MSAATPALPGEDDRVHRSDADGGKAQAALWWKAVPTMPGERLGIIGDFSADSPIASAALLEEAERQLRLNGCTLAIGPMNGTTWRSYRFVTEPGTEPTFFLEPKNPAEWPEWWRASGYQSLASYYSTATDDLGRNDERLVTVSARMAAAGVKIRPFNPADFEQELSRIFDVSVISFQPNFLYTPLPKEEFVAQYRPLRERLQPALVLLAEQHGAPVGYVFAVPDFAQAQRGENVSTFIVKTLAVLPGRAFAGLGALLLGEVHAAARALGFKRAIHALMHETNQSRNLSAHYARTIRRYALFSKRLLT